MWLIIAKNCIIILDESTNGDGFMLNSRIRAFTCSPSKTVIEAMKRINSNSCGLLYVVDETDYLLGCFSDGNARRWIINGGCLDAQISEAMDPRPFFVTEENRDESIAIMQEQQIRSVAVVDGSRHLIDVILANPHTVIPPHKNKLSGTSVIVMAGGKGTRLYPYTKILPKPLIPIGDVPILERILKRFAEYGVRDFYITLNYRKEMIKSYFSESSIGYRIHYVEEEKALGTAGSIRLINEEFLNPIIVTNCDILIDADYADILKFHKESGNDITIVSALKNTTIPYGVLHAKENGVITDMEEKPELSHFVNTGMYVINPKFIEWIPKGKVFHMTQLLELMLKKKKKVCMYPISENSFLDMGEFAEMKRMEERINAGFVE